MCFKDNIPALFHRDKAYQSCVTFDPLLAQGSYKSNPSMELDLISHRHCRHTVVLVYGDNVNSSDKIANKSSQEVFQNKAWVMFYISTIVGVSKMNFSSNSQLMNRCILQRLMTVLACLVLPADWAAHGAGARGVPQHTQEDGVMSTGTHRCRCREETCKLVTIKPLSNNSTFKKNKLKPINQLFQGV